MARCRVLASKLWALEAALPGCRFRLENLCRTVEGACPDVAGDLKELLREQEI